MRKNLSYEVQVSRMGAGIEYFVVRVGDHKLNGLVLFWNSEMTPRRWLVEE